MKLLLKEVTDRYIQENFKRLEQAFNNLGNSTGSGITNVTNTTIESAALWKGKQTTVIASATKVVDTIALNSILSLEYVFTIYNDSEQVVRSFNYKVLNLNGSISDVLFAKLGSAINIEVSSASNGGNLEITIKNNELYNLEVKLTRLDH